MGAKLLKCIHSPTHVSLWYTELWIVLSPRLQITTSRNAKVSLCPCSNATDMLYAWFTVNSLTLIAVGLRLWLVFYSHNSSGEPNRQSSWHVFSNSCAMKMSAKIRSRDLAPHGHSRQLISRTYSGNWISCWLYINLSLTLFVMVCPNAASYLLYINYQFAASSKEIFENSGCYVKYLCFKWILSTSWSNSYAFFELSFVWKSCRTGFSSSAAI